MTIRSMLKTIMNHKRTGYPSASSPSLNPNETQKDINKGSNKNIHVMECDPRVERKRETKEKKILENGND